MKKNLLTILSLIITLNSNAKQPNVIYILADDLGYGDISAFNPNSKIKTTNLDKLASQGLKFTDAHTSSSVCTPTRYGILTGRYNWRSAIKQGVFYGKDKHLIPPTRTTIASLLKQNNYNTAFIGKWHLGWDWAIKNKKIDYIKNITNGPKSVGFTYSYGHIASLDIPPYVYVENDKPTSTKITKIKKNGSYGFYRAGDIGHDFDMDDVTPKIFRKSIKYITQQSKQEKPFFLYLALPSPHTPILPNKPFQGKSNLNPYGDFVLQIDHHIGQLLQAVKNAGLEDNTIIVFTSDNGCSPQAKFDVLAKKNHHPSYIYRGHKADLFEGGHRVPFIIKYPTKIKPNTTTNKTICTTDFLATIADINNIPLTDNQAEDSFSLTPLFNKSSEKNFQRTNTIHHSINGSFAITHQNFKLILAPGSGGWSYPRPKEAQKLNLPPVQLYNLASDPAEKNNLIKQNPQKVKQLYNLLIKTIDQGRSTPGNKQKNDKSKHNNWPQLKKLRKIKLQ